MSIVAFNQLYLNQGGHCLLDKASWQLEANAKIALVGRNGAGKSTLLQLIAGQLEADGGQINRQNGLKIASLIQDVPTESEESVYHFLVKSLGSLGALLSDYYELSKGDDLKKLSHCQQKMDEIQAWDWLPQIETMASRLDINPNLPMKSLSGGMRRRVLLAAALIAKPDLLLLDEPTNHLDLKAIEWLENYLKNFSGAMVVVTHDRRFLAEVADSIVEIDRGKLYSFACDYESYLDRRELLREAENRQNLLFDKRLAEEETWIRQGIKARRTRNEGRVRALKAMRQKAIARRIELGQVKNLSLDVKRSGNLVIEAKGVHFSFKDKVILKDFNLLLTRGDKVGIIGPNGSGKTTLIKLLLSELKPDSGTIKQGVSLEIAYFDQYRSQLIEHETVMYNVAEGADFVTIQGKQKHVASYLKDFLFAPERFNQPVSTLSGGEKNRLLLAKLLARPVNLMVMDEPTNDLDIDTLELLEQLLLEYRGTLLLISHDRAFINNVVTSILVYEEEGIFAEFIGSYDDYCQHKKAAKVETVVQRPVKSSPSLTKAKLTFNEQFELKELPKKIEALEEKIALKQTKMLETDFYKQDQDKISIFSQELAKEEKELADYYKRWELLESKK